MEDTGCQVAGFWVRMDALSGPWRWASRCDWRSFSAVSRPSLIVSSMGDRDEGRPESEKDRVCSVWYAMGIRDYGTPESEKRQSVVYGMPWESGIMAHQSLKRQSVVYGMPWESGIMAHQSEKRQSVVYGMPWESGIMADQSLKKDSLSVWCATGARNYGRQSVMYSMSVMYTHTHTHTHTNIRN